MLNGNDPHRANPTPYEVTALQHSCRTGMSNCTNPRCNHPRIIHSRSMSNVCLLYLGSDLMEQRLRLLLG